MPFGDTGRSAKRFREDRGLQRLDTVYRADEGALIEALSQQTEVSLALRQRIYGRSLGLIRKMRDAGKPGLMELFLAEYGLSTNEGLALMCLAEALLRVPDQRTVDRLIEDKIAPQEWNAHLGKSQSTLVNASTIGLMLTGRVLDDHSGASVTGLLNRLVKRLGEPVVRLAVRHAMKEMGDQFVLGQTIEEALKRGQSARRQGYLYSYDMLGEASLTACDSQAYFDAYAHAIRVIGKRGQAQPIQTASGISVKLSALHPRFEFIKAGRVFDELTPRLVELARAARAYGLGFTIDAEEADRLDLTLQIFGALLEDETLAGWDGLGLAVQAYGKRAAAAIDWLYAAASRQDRKIMIRLVKGAYWDTEIKQAQVDGVDDFPVFTRREATDISYICCAQKLLGMTERIYPQFATHNAQTAAAILEMAGPDQCFEFQRLHGMGETLHHLLLKQEKARCRIYAPVGPHKDLLAYLVRRLLENGANSSFVNQVVDPRWSPEQIAEDPFERFSRSVGRRQAALKNPTQIFAPERLNSRGWTLNRRSDAHELDRARAPFATASWSVEPILSAKWTGDGRHPLCNPCRPDELVGQVISASAQDAETAIELAQDWRETSPQARSAVLRRAAVLFEDNFGEILAVLCREAGKTQADAIAELREAVDFLRYYACRAEDQLLGPAAGIVACISPWNFPLAIFTGQIAAALAAGNGVIAKPAEATPIIASLAVSFLHQAGVPVSVLQFLPGSGAQIGQLLVSSPQVSGACFTGSTATAQAINRSLSALAAPDSFLIAETGGLNAAIVDSTALLEQAVRDTIQSAFLSAGQRCSALRCLYVQEDIADQFEDMLLGAMDELEAGDPWDLGTDIGPVISADARDQIQAYVDKARAEGRLLKQLPVPDTGYFVGPSVIKVNRIAGLTREVFGPVLHLARFTADEFYAVLDQINATGYGLTFGLHSRIDDRVREISDRLRVGNIYVNRNQIGAIVGSQPFGGEGLSGTGPKAGGPSYVQRFTRSGRTDHGPLSGTALDTGTVQAALEALQPASSECLSRQILSGPTGERNEYSVWPRGVALCLGPTLEDARCQARSVGSTGCAALIIAPGARPEEGLDGHLAPEALTDLRGFAVAVLWADDHTVRRARMALAQKDGPILPLVSGTRIEACCRVERHTCIDTTAAGGNATLLGGLSEADERL